MKPDFATMGATFDAERDYRYTLWRTWQQSGKGYVNFIMLNPSTADEQVLDPTVRRCVGFAQDWGYDGIYVTNLFAFRATDPAQIYAIMDPVGPANDKYIIETASHAAIVVCAWGTHGKLNGRGLEVAAKVEQFHPQCLGLTKKGFPKHPLYLRRTADLFDFRISVARELAAAR